ncbi:MAG: AbrB/MazE/SpoVT family DNA-binding domain-containing protein [Alphaproteobacteria bacterium]
MAGNLKVRKIGNSYGVILPKRLIEELGVKEGDRVFWMRTPDGIKLTPYDPDFAAVIEANRDYMRRHRNALRQLAKR